MGKLPAQLMYPDAASAPRKPRSPRRATAERTEPREETVPQTDEMTLRQRAASVITSGDPWALVGQALRLGGYGGDLRPPSLTYLAATARVLSMRPGAMLPHILLLGSPGAGKNYTVSAVLRLLPPQAYHVIDAGSHRVVIYDKASLRHRVLVFGEADNLPMDEENSAASAVRNLLQDHYLHYDVTIRDKESGDYTVRTVRKPGPTVMLTTATRRLGEQLDSRLFSVEIRDNPEQVRAALATQAVLELQPIEPPSDALMAYQELLQGAAPWDVIVPFAPELAHLIGKLPTAARVARDFARLLSLVKAVTVLRHPLRQRDDLGRLVAEATDYATVYDLVRETYASGITGLTEAVCDVVNAVVALRDQEGVRVTVTAVADHLGITKMAAFRRVGKAINAGWLINEETRRGHPADLRPGEPLPTEGGLPTPESVNAVTGGVTDPVTAETRSPLGFEGYGNAVTPKPGRDMETTAEDGQLVVAAGGNGELPLVEDGRAVVNADGVYPENGVTALPQATTRATEPTERSHPSRYPMLQRYRSP